VEGAKPQALIATSIQTHAQSASDFIDMLFYDNIDVTDQSNLLSVRGNIASDLFGKELIQSFLHICVW
jgi:hypothetical protein